MFRNRSRVIFFPSSQEPGWLDNTIQSCCFVHQIVKNIIKLLESVGEDTHFLKLHIYLFLLESWLFLRHLVCLYPISDYISQVIEK